MWCPYKQGDIKEIEKIQKRATKGPSGVQAARQGPLESLVSGWPA